MFECLPIREMMIGSRLGYTEGFSKRAHAQFAGSFLVQNPYLARLLAAKDAGPPLCEKRRCHF